MFNRRPKRFDHMCAVSAHALRPDPLTGAETHHVACFVRGGGAPPRVAHEVHTFRPRRPYQSIVADHPSLAFLFWCYAWSVPRHRITDSRVFPGPAPMARYPRGRRKLQVCQTRLVTPAVCTAKALGFSLARRMHIHQNMKTLSQIQGERVRAEMAAVRAQMAQLAIRAAAQKVGV